MIVWAIVVVMTGAAIAAVLVPLLRRQDATVDAAEYDIEVYKDQLDKVGEDFDRGLLTTAQIEAAKIEISRRILNADRRRENAKPATAGASKSINRILAAVLALSIPALALGFYARLGAPDLPSQPFAERADQRNASRQASISLEDSAAKLAKRLETEPADLNGWILLGQTYKSLGSYAKSVEVFKQALYLDPGDPDVNSAYGEALYLAADRIVTQTSQKAFRSALKIDPTEPRARYYLAMAEEQAGNRQAALDGWVAMVADAPADAPWLDSVRGQIRQVATELGIDPASIMPQPRAAGIPTLRVPPSSGSGTGRGPTASQMAAAAQMSPEERQKLITGMIESLANRLAENPEDFQGWLRLIRAYAVQNQKDKALAALAAARQAFKAAPVPTQRLAALANELGLETSGGGAAAPGPTREEVAAVRNMSPEDRRALIEKMIARLAGKLAENPNDVAGWTRLARSYTVLKQQDKARDALSKALEVAPENIDLLTLYGRTIRGANDDKQSPQSVVVMRRVLSLDPNNIEALWFVGGAEAAAGNTEAAKAIWQKAMARLEPGSRERAQFRQRLDALK